MFALKIDNDFIELPEGQTFTLVKNSELFNTELPEGEYSYPLNLHINSFLVNKYFGSFRKIQNLKDFKKVDVQIYFKGQPIETNARLVFRKIKNNVIQGFILTGSSILANALKTTPINSIDYGTFDTGNGHQDMVNHMLQTTQNFFLSNHVFAPVFAPNFRGKDGGVSYSKFINQFAHNGGVFIQNQDYFSDVQTAYVPFPKLSFILNKIFENFGYTLDWPLLNDPDFRKIVIVNNAELAYLRETQGFAVSGGQQAMNGSFSGMTSIIQGQFGTEARQNPLVTNFLNFNLDESSSFFTNILSFDLQDNSYTVINAGIQCKVNFYFRFGYHPNNAVLYNNKFNFEVWLDNELVGAWNSPFLAPNNDEKTVNDEIEFSLPGNAIGKKIRFKAAIVNFCPTCYDYLNNAGYVYSVLYTNILACNVSFAEPQTATVSNVIDYRNHLSNIDCSSFLNAIRKRFGAYVSNVDFVNKKISFRQLKDVASKTSSDPLFKNRDKIYQMELSFHRFLFEEQFENDSMVEEPEFTDEIHTGLTMGNLTEEAEEDNIKLLFPTLFNKRFGMENGTALYPCFGVEGKFANGEAAIMRLAMFHGYQPLSTFNNVNIPFVNGLNYNILGVKIANFNLSVNFAESLWETFWKSWYQLFYIQEKYTFDVFPDLKEVKDFQFDEVDFYTFSLFLCEKVTFRFQRNKILKSDVSFIKVNPTLQ
jgi:hypothetical protein